MTNKKPYCAGVYHNEFSNHIRRNLSKWYQIIEFRDIGHITFIGVELTEEEVVFLQLKYEGITFTENKTHTQLKFNVGTIQEFIRRLVELRQVEVHDEE